MGDAMIPRLASRFLFLSIAIGGLLFAGILQVYLQHDSLIDDTEMVSLASRQRVLSQQIAKCALLLQQETDPASMAARREELAVLIDEWKEVQDELVAVGEREISKDSSEEITLLFGRLNNAFASLVPPAEALLIPRRPDELQPLVQSLLQAENYYIETMDEIDEGLLDHIREHRSSSWLAQLVFFGLAGGVLLGQLFFVFFPAIRRIQKEIAGNRLREDRFRKLVAASNEAIFILKDDRVTAVNYVVEQLTCWSEQEWIGRRLRDRLPLLNPSEVVHETVIRSKDGTHRNVEVLKRHFESEADENSTIIIMRDLTDHKRIKKELQLLGHAVDQSIDGITITDLEGRITYRNRAAAEQYGHPGSQAVGRHVNEFHCEIDPSQPSQVSEARMLGGATREIREKRVDGSAFLAAISTSIIFDSDGQPFGLLSISRDITAQKESERALRESREQFKLVLDNAAHGYWDWDLAADTVYRDENWYRIFGIDPTISTPDDYLWEYSIHEEDRETVEAHLQNHLAFPDQPFDIEYRVWKGGGQLIWVHSRGRVISFDEEGKPLRMIGTIVDTTGRKEAVLNLQASQRHLQTIIESAPIGMAIASYDGLMTDVNEALVQILGFSKEDLIGKSILDLTFEADLPGCLNGLRALRDGEIENYRGERRLVHRDGSLIWVSSSVVLVRSPSDEESYYIVQLQNITDRKQAEIALHESQQKFQNAFSNAAIGMCLVATNGRFISVNDALCSMLGYTKEELLRISVRKLAYPEDLKKDLDELRLLLQGKIRTYRMEKRYIHKTGRIVWTMLSVSMVSDPDGKPLYFISQIQDISDSKQAEKDLLESRRRYQQLFEKAPVMYVVTNDVDGVPIIADCNAAFLKTLGYERDEVINRQMIDFYSPSSTQELLEGGYQAALSGRFITPIDRQLLTRNGELVNTILQAVPTTDEFGIARGILAMYSDISVQKRSEKFMQTILDNNSQATVLIGRDGRVLLYNQEASHQIQRLFKCQITQGVAITEILPDALFPYFRKYFDSALSGESILARDWKHKDRQQTIWFQLSFIPVFNSENEVEAVCFSGLEITHRKEMEEALRQAKNQAETANRAKSTFLANMSHELRTPLNAILGFSQLMSQEIDLLPHQKANLETINRSGEHLLKLINDILEVSKIEAGRVEIAIEPFNLDGLLSALYKMFSLQAEAKGITLNFSYDRVPHHLIGDETRLRQMLINLLGNALKFTERGSVSLEVEATERVGNKQWLSFIVRDSGPGIAEEEQGKLFEPFSQTSTGLAMEQGTGLGLTIVSQYTHLLGGQLSVSSHTTPGKSGTVFQLNLPFILGRERSHVPEEPRKQKRLPKLAAGQPACRILIADDNRLNRMLMYKMVLPLGLEIQEATDGKEAVELWESWQPDLVFMDIRMPIMDGFEAIRTIRASAVGKQPQIVVVTANAFENTEQAVLAAGANGYLRKPFKLTEIYDILEQVLGLKFLYESEEKPANGAKTNGAECLPALSADWRVQMDRTITRGNFEEMIALIDRIPEESRPFADRLRKMAEQFDYESIAQLLESVPHG